MLCHDHTVLLALVLVPLFVYADTDIVIPNPLEHESFAELADAIAGLVFNVALAGVILGVLVGAFFILTSGGEPKRWQKGKQVILYTMIGLAIILLARGITGVLKYVLGYEG